MTVETRLELEAEQRGVIGQREHERAQVAAHYEHDPEIFALVLDRRLGYATGMFDDEHEDLETAQSRKYAWIRDRLALTPGARALDVGCGWGSNLLYLAEHTGADMWGVTLSARQRDEALARAHEIGVADRVRVDVAHVEDLVLEPASLDAALFVGSVVHMHQRAVVHRNIAAALRPGGRLLISDCFFPIEPRGDRNSAATRFIFEEALGYCRLLHLSDELRLLEEQGLDIVTVVDVTKSYACTLGCWIDNVRRNRARIDALAPDFARVLQVYMTIARQSFARRVALEYMIVAVKGGAGR